MSLGTGIEDRVSAVRAVTSNIAERPHGLLSDIRLMTTEKIALMLENYEYSSQLQGGLD